MPQSILIVQTAFLGDIILSTPVIGALKKKFPSAQISVLTTKGGAQLLQHDLRINKIIVYDKRGAHSGLIGLIKIAKLLRKHKYDIVYSLHKSFRTSLMLFLTGINKRIGFKQSKLSFLYTEKKNKPKDVHDVFRNLSILDNYDESDADLIIKPRPKNQVQVEVQNKLEHIGNYILVSPGSVWLTKRWDEKQARLLVQTLAKQCSVVVTGSKEESKLCKFVCSVTTKYPVIDLSGELELDELSYVVDKSTAVVCNDSMVLHLASAFKKPVVCVFCATSPSFGFGPFKTRNIVVEAKGLSCKPCNRHGANYCPTGTHKCRTLVSYQDVYAAVYTLLAEKNEGCINE